MPRIAKKATEAATPRKNGNLAVDYRPLHSLIPYARNARTHTDAQIGQIAASIREFGWTQPILVDGESGVIAGHARLIAAEKLGMDKVPCIELAHLNPAQKKAYILADNKLTLNAGWDDALLRLELVELRDLDFNLSLTGFDERELLALTTEQVEGLTDPDEVPDVPADPATMTGDLWVLGSSRLLCGDCTQPEQRHRLTEGNPADLMLTDPPYGINIVKVDGASVGGSKPVTIDSKRVGTMSANGAYPFRGKKKLTATDGGGKLVDANEYYPIHGDDKPFDPSHLIGLARNHILFGGNYFASRLPDGRCWIVWNKNNTGHFADCELAWTDLDHGVKRYDFTWNGLVREGPRTEELSKRIHPTQKPVGLFAAIIQDFTKSDAIVLDPYVGSGSTIIACERTRRICTSMEIELHYCDVSIERWQNFTGKEATLEGDGRTFAQIKAERLGNMPILPKENQDPVLRSPEGRV